MAEIENLHDDGASIAEAINEKVDSVLPFEAAVATTGVVHPANSAYTQADQTALAACVLALVTAVNDLTAALVSAGIMASS